MDKQMTLKGFAVIAIAAALITGCSRGDDGANSSKVDTAAGPGRGGVSGSLNGAAAGMTDANIFYLLDVANRADSAKGSLALTKGTSAEVRDFARIMVRDHQTMRAQGEALAKRLSVQPTPPAGDSLTAKLDSAFSRLTAAAKGRDFDKAYMDHEVAAHREVLTIATSAMNVTQNSEIKNLIQNAAPMLQAHMDKAQTVQKNLQK